MISFKQYLQEAVIKPWTTTDVKLKECINLLNTHCKNGLNAVSNGGVLFRGFTGTKQPSKYHLIDTTGSLRTSRDSNNIYQIIMDNSPALAKFPKRSESLICSTDRYIANQYSSHGDVMVVIPFDGTLIAASKEDDFLNDTYIDTLLGEYELSDLMHILSNMLFGLGIKSDLKKFKFADLGALEQKLSSIPTINVLYSILYHFYHEGDDSLFDNDKNILDVLSNTNAKYATNKKAIKQLEEVFKSGKSKSKVANKIYSILINNRSNILMALFSNAFTPQNLGVKLFKQGQSLDGFSECWFSGKAMLMDVSTFASILGQLKLQKFPIHKDYSTMCSDGY